jgi:hypothetical protein
MTPASCDEPRRSSSAARVLDYNQKESHRRFIALIVPHESEAPCIVDGSQGAWTDGALIRIGRNHDDEIDGRPAIQLEHTVISPLRSEIPNP